MNKDIIWIKCSTSNYYRLIKKLEVMNIVIYDIKYKEDIIYLKVDSKDYQKISKYLISYKFEIVSNTGIKKIIDYIKKNNLFIICLVIGGIFFVILNNLIVDVNIIHESKYIRELLLEELDNYNISPLHFKKSYKELDEIREKILDKYPSVLDWMEFVVTGMKIDVRVEERIITNTDKDDKKCNIVAKKDGVISEILVTNGEAKVMINDYVRKGDILISGIIKHNEEEKRITCAKGEVYATTWYKAKASIPFIINEYKKTGNKRYNLVWKNKNSEKEIFRSKFKVKDRKLKEIIKIFDYGLYFEVEEEIKKNSRKISTKEAEYMGINKVIESINKKISKKDVIIDKKVLKKVVNDSTMDIDVFIVLKELINAEEEIVVEEGID